MYEIGEITNNDAQNFDKRRILDTSNIELNIQNPTCNMVLTPMKSTGIDNRFCLKCKQVRQVMSAKNLAMYFTRNCDTEILEQT